MAKWISSNRKLTLPDPVAIINAYGFCCKGGRTPLSHGGKYFAKFEGKNSARAHQRVF